MVDTTYNANLKQFMKFESYWCKEALYICMIWLLLSFLNVLYTYADTYDIFTYAQHFISVAEKDWKYALLRDSTVSYNCTMNRQQSLLVCIPVTVFMFIILHRMTSLKSIEGQTGFSGKDTMLYRPNAPNQTTPESQPELQELYAAQLKELSAKNLEVGKFVSLEKRPDSYPCTTTCQELRNLLSKWKPNIPKAAINYLTNTERVNMLMDTLNELHRNFNSKYRYPIIIFHEASLRLFL